MGSSFGGTIKLKGESEYKKALSEITSNLKVLNSEMKTVTSQYDRNDKSVSNLTQQNEVLNKKIDEQRSKVKTLAQALEDSKRETGNNSDTTKKWQIQLNNAQADLNKMERQVKNNNEAIKKEAEALDKAEDELKDYSKATSSAGGKTSRLGDIIKGNLTSTAIIGGVKALGGAIVNIGKQALEAYASYEQLVGGVDTLFGKSSKLVQENAQNAYKTSGLSANQYMEQITSFSASLLQSLGGDTKKSAEYGDMAIRDMSDNANKMGTAMDSIQNAYQGFAKQNYTIELMSVA